MNHRTALIVAAAVAAVVFAAALAVAVNLGILTAADSSPVGQLSTTSLSQAAATPAAGNQVDAAGTTEAATAPAKPRRQTQDYVIRKAGKVRIAFSDKAVRFVAASARGGWTWKLSQTQDDKLSVTFSHGSDTFTFVARVGADGKVTAKVDHPVTRVVPSSGGTSSWTAAPVPASASPAAGESGGDHEYQGEADD